MSPKTFCSLESSCIGFAVGHTEHVKTIRGTNVELRNIKLDGTNTKHKNFGVLDPLKMDRWGIPKRR